MSALSALVVPAIVSAVVTLIMTIMLDRWYGFFHALGLENVDIYPQKSITIYANATPQPITAIQLGYRDYNLLFKIEKSSTGFIIPKITKLKK